MSNDAAPGTQGLHRHVHLAALAMALAVLPWSEFLLSLSQIILVGNWLWEGVARKRAGHRFKLALATPESAVFLSFLGLHVLGLAWTTDLQWGLDLCRILLPVLVFGLVLPTVPRLSTVELKRLLLLGAWSAAASTVACLWLRHDALAQGDYRGLSPFISHIRLGLMLCMSVAVLVYYWPRRWPLRLAHLLAIVWCLWFMDQLRSLTTLPVLAALMLYALWRIFRHRGKLWRTGAVALLLLAMAGGTLFIGSVAKNHPWSTQQLENVQLEERSAGGEVYFHNLQDPQLENGHYVWINVADEELLRTWQRRSQVPFWGKDAKGQPLRGTLVRYLASMDRTKDSVGVVSLSNEDVKRIEAGVTNALEGRNGAMRARLDQVFYEIDRYRRSGDPNGHSVTMRLEFLRTGLYIARNNWLYGVGTGDTQLAFDRAFDELHSPLEPQWRLRAHNQFLTLFISFGVFGFVWGLFTWWWPAWRLRAFRQPLFIAWGIIFLISCLTDDTIETQMGATFFALYFGLFVFAAPMPEEGPAPAPVRSA